MKNFIASLFFIYSGLTLSAQTALTLKQAVALGMENNYAIRMVENQSEIAHNNNHPGRAGFLPKLSFNSGLNFSNSSINQSYASGLEVNRSGVNSTNLNSSLAMNWTVFDGMRMFATRDRLRELDRAGEINLKVAAEKTVEQIVVTYCELVRTKQLIKAYQANLDISLERQSIAEKKLSVGTGSKPEVLQAKVDANAQRSVLIQQEQLLMENKTRLNLLLARDPLTEFEVEDSVAPSAQGSFSEIQQRFRSNNNYLKMLQVNIRLSELEAKEIRGQRMPMIALNAAYGYSRTENQAGFVLLNQNNGLNYGLTLSIPIFSGFNLSRDHRNAMIRLENARLQQRDSSNQLSGSLQIAWRQYENDLRLLALEEENAQLAEENLNLALERFRLGATDVLVLKDAQSSFEAAAIRLANARFNRTVSETKLKRLDGTIWE